MVIGGRHLIGNLRVVTYPGWKVPVIGWWEAGGHRQFVHPKVVAEMVVEHLQSDECHCTDSYPHPPWSIPLPYPRENRR